MSSLRTHCRFQRISRLAKGVVCGFAVGVRAFRAAIMLAAIAAGTLSAQQYDITTLAGGAPLPTPAVAVNLPLLDYPMGMTVDAVGNLYFSTFSQTGSSGAVYKVDSSGTLTRVAGNGRAGFSGDGGKALDAQFDLPGALATDLSGNLYIADISNLRVRKVALDGTITTVAGGGNGADGGPAIGAALGSPGGIAVDSLGNLYIVEEFTGQVRKVSPQGTISTLATIGFLSFPSPSSCTVAATLAQTHTRQSVALDQSGNLYVANCEGVVHQVDPSGAVTEAVRGGSPLAAVAVDPQGSIYIADPKHFQIKKLTLPSTTVAFAGTGLTGYSGDGGPANKAKLENTQALALDPAGNLFILDGTRIRKVSASGIITTIAGNGVRTAFWGDGGTAAQAGLDNPSASASDPVGNVYILDSGNSRIRKVAPDGAIATIAGNGTDGDSGDGGLASAARVDVWTGVTADSTGNLYFVQWPYETRHIRKISADGTISTIAGNGSQDFSGDGGLAIDAGISPGDGMTIDNAGNLYFADESQRIRSVSAAGVITTVAGSGNAGFAGDGGPATSADLHNPSGVAVDVSGNLYIVDASNYRVRKVSTDGVISTIAGNGTQGYSGDGGSAPSAQFSWSTGWATGIAVDAARNVFVSDDGRVRKISPDGIITTIAGSGSLIGYSGDGSTALGGQWQTSSSLTIDGTGNLYFTDPIAGAIRKLHPLVSPTAPSLTVQLTHDAFPQPGQTTINMTIVVSSAAPGLPTSGTVTVTENLPSGFTLLSIAGSGWNCAANLCSRGDSLSPGASFPALLVSASLNGIVPLQDYVNQVSASGGGSTYTATASDTITFSSDVPTLSVTSTHIGGFIAGQVGTYQIAVRNTSSTTPSNGTVTVSETLPASLTLTSMTGLGWVCASNTCARTDALAPGATYSPIVVTVDVAANAPPSVTNQVSVSGGGSVPAQGTDVTGIGTAGSPGQPALPVPSDGATAVPLVVSLGWTVSGSVTSNDVYFGTTNPPPFIGSTVENSIIPPDLHLGTTYYWKIVSKNNSVSSPSTVWSFTTVAALHFIPVTPCRILDTRKPDGPFGGPEITAGTSRDFVIPSSTCNIPLTAQAYSLNVTAVPPGPLGYLTIWPAGQAKPVVSTLNSLDGRIKANAAIVPAGNGGAVSVFASSTTQVVLDIDGYFVPATDPSALAFYPLAPCRVSDSRHVNGPLGGPLFPAGTSRTVPILLSNCGVPASAKAYSLNITAVPTGSLGYVTTWPTGQAKPTVSTLNALTGAITANAAIVPAGDGGAIDLFASSETNLVVDINGYFAPTGVGGLSLYALPPCRVMDSRKPVGSLVLSAGVPLDVDVMNSNCGAPLTAQAYVLNATVVPTPAGLGYLTLWPQGAAKPGVSTLNALDGQITSNMAILPTTNGSISAYPSSPTHVVLDISAYFAE